MLEKCTDYKGEVTPPVSCNSRENGNLSLPESCPICKGKKRITILTKLECEYGTINFPIECECPN